MKKCLPLLFILIAGCAKPKYWTPEPGSRDDSQPPLQNAAGECSFTFKNSGVCLNWFWEIQPTLKNRASLILKTYRLNKYDQTIVYVDLGEPPVLAPWMPSMGHGTAKTRTTVIDTGTYRINNISLYMTGEWQLDFIINNNNEKIDEAQFKITM